jgi:hypothetical protein
MLGVFNWSEGPATIEAPLPGGRFRVLDAWKRNNLGVNAGSIVVDVPSHGCRLLAVRPVESTATQDRELPPLFRAPVD